MAVRGEREPVEWALDGEDWTVGREAERSAVG
jgi:hypothetical protein